jgi:hypothetical protein
MKREQLLASIRKWCRKPPGYVDLVLKQLGIPKRDIKR